MPRYNQISPYPTGRAPFAVDLSQQMWNIAQERVQARKEEIKENKLKISENEEFLLKAFDLDTVKGAQDKTTIEIGNMLKEHVDKWALKSKDNEKPGILTTEQKFEVLRDRREIKDRMQIAASEVAQFEQLQKDMADPKKAAMYDPQTFIDMGKYAKEGRIGEGKLINLIKYKPQAIGQDFMAEVEGLAQSMKINTNFSQETTGIREDGQTKWKFTNKPMVNNLVARAQMLPSFQNLAKENYGQAMELLKSIPNYYTIERYDYEQDKTGSASGGKTAKQIEDEKIQNEKFGSFNNLALNLMDMDAGTINSLVSGEPGQIRDIYYEQSPDGGTDMVVDFSQKSTSGTVITRASEKIRVPKDMSDSETQKTFYNKLWQILPDDVKKGVEFADISKTMKPRAGEYKGRKVPYRNVQKIESKLDEVISNPKSSFKNTILGNGIFKAAADSINTWMKKVNPKASKIEGTNKGFIVDGKEYKMIDAEEGTTKTPEELKKRVMSDLNPPKIGNPNAPEAESSAPKEITPIITQDQIDKQIELKNTIGYDSLLNLYIKKYPNTDVKILEAELAKKGIKR